MLAMMDFSRSLMVAVVEEGSAWVAMSSNEGREMLDSASLGDRREC